MKFYGQLLGLALLQTSAVAFSPLGSTAASKTALQAADGPIFSSPNPAGQGEKNYELFPVNPPMETIQGGGTVKTYQMPPWAERAQYTLETYGRPLKCTVQLWVGPLRNVHTMTIDSEDGRKTPYSATIKFKKLGPTLKISTSDDVELPVLASVSVPPPERSDELGEIFDDIWDNCIPEEKQKIQGGSTEGGPGTVRTWSIPNNVNSVHLMAWSKYVSKLSLKAKIEVLQGPNNHKQDMFLQCGGGSQPYHAVIDTPGDGWLIRVTNKKFVEDGLFEMAIVPFEVIGDRASTKVAPGQGYVSARSVGDSQKWKPENPNKKWWER